MSADVLKRSLATFQVQFVGIMVHAFQLLFIECDYPRAFVWWIGMHAVMFFFLFKDFYNQSYSKPKVCTTTFILLSSVNVHSTFGINYPNICCVPGSRPITSTRDDRNKRHNIQERFAEERLHQRAHERHVRAVPYRAAGRQLTADKAPTLAFRSTLWFIAWNYYGTLIFLI